jgi:hypothetical protein
MVLTIYQVSGVKVLIENNESQNKNIGGNGGGPAKCPDYSADRYTEEISVIF